MRHVFQLYNSTILRLSYWNEIGYTTQKDRYFRDIYKRLFLVFVIYTLTLMHSCLGLISDIVIPLGSLIKMADE